MSMKYQRRRLWALGLSLASALFAVLPTVEARSEPWRTPTIDDFLRLSELGVTKASPDGTLLAVEVARPRSRSPETGNADGDRTDIWIVELETGRPTQITNGAESGSAYWSPIWSPDGHRLAFLTNEGHLYSRVAIWQRNTGKVTIVDGRRSIDIRSNFGGSWLVAQWRKWGEWINSTTLLTVFMPEEELADSYRFGGAENPAADWGPRWARTSRGEVSVTVWDNRKVFVCGSEDTLATIDVENGTVHELIHGAVRAVSLSPDRRYIAVIVATKPLPVLGIDGPMQVDEMNGFNPDTHVETDLRVFDLRFQRDLGVVSGAEHLNFLSPRRLPRWTPTGEAFAVPAHHAAGSDAVYYVTVPSLTLQTVAARSMLDAEVLAELLVQSQRDTPLSNRADKRPLYAPAGPTMFGSVPGDMFRLYDHRVGVFLNGKLSVLGSRGELEQQLSIDNGVLVYPRVSEGPVSSVFVWTGDQLHRIDILRGTMRARRLTRPTAQAKLAAAVPSKNLYVFESQEETGTYLLVRGHHSFTALEFNRHLAEIRPPQRRLITYALPSGRLVHGVLWLPRDYRPEHKFPLIVEAYPGAEVHELSANSLNSFYKYQANLFAAAGYGYLFASVPTRSDERTQEPISYFVQPVSGAIDAALSQGYADPDRLGFRGHSFGGYLALALEAKPNKFKAIVASAPFPDLMDLHDLPTPMESLNVCAPSLLRARGTQQTENPGVPLNLGVAPLADVEAYIRNSPYFQMKEATTPLLILYGEFDGDLPGVEKLFMALDRRGVTVQLARYWGESHNIQTVGNVRDAWERELRWFDSWLRPDVPSASH